MRKSAGILGVLAGLVLIGPVAGQTEEKKPTRVLLVTGRDVGAHKWRETTPVLREHLEKSGAFEVLVSEEPLVLESSAVEQYDVILLNYFNWQKPTLSDKARQNLADFVKGGKGLVAFHFSTAAWPDWNEYRDLIGRVWVMGKSGHGPRGKFQVKVKNKDHFITRGIEDFEADDELYAKLEGDTPIKVLVEADSDWSKKTEPLVWTLEPGKGRVFGYVLGHDAKACSDPNFAKLLVRGTLWAAKKDAQ